MKVQWFLCKIERFPSHEEKQLKIRDNLSVQYPDVFIDSLTPLLVSGDVVLANKEGRGDWFVWLPIIPRVGDVLQFAGWQVEVSRVELLVDWRSKDGIQDGMTTAARICIRDDVLGHLFDSQYSIDHHNQPASHTWETFARRGHDLQYYAWELRHSLFLLGAKDSNRHEYYRWHTRVRPVQGDVIKIREKRWRVLSVELTSANNSVDGFLDVEPLTT